MSYQRINRSSGPVLRSVLEEIDILSANLVWGSIFPRRAMRNERFRGDEEKGAPSTELAQDLERAE